jgi:D-threo-aldose 1-dehydrogenase
VGRLLREPASPGSFDPAPWVGGLPLDVEFDYTYDGIMRSHDESLERLGMDRVDLLLVHDLDSIYHDRPQLAAHSRALRTSGWKALMDLRTAGVAKGIGAGVNDRGTISRLLDAFDLEFVMVAMPYTLLDQGLLDDELPLCERRGVAVVVGSPFASGILATGPRAGARYAYRDVDARMIARVRAIEASCAQWGTSLAAAALQFPLAHPSVVSVVPGSSRPSTFARIAAAFSESIPPGLWPDLKAKGLIREDAPVPGSRSSQVGQEDQASSDTQGGAR